MSCLPSPPTVFCTVKRAQVLENLLCRQPPLVPPLPSASCGLAFMASPTSSPVLRMTPYTPVVRLSAQTCDEALPPPFIGRLT